jgi:hypothetical protein
MQSRVPVRFYCFDQRLVHPKSLGYEIVWKLQKSQYCSQIKHQRHFTTALLSCYFSCRSSQAWSRWAISAVVISGYCFVTYKCERDRTDQTVTRNREKYNHGQTTWQTQQNCCLKGKWAIYETSESCFKMRFAPYSTCLALVSEPQGYAWTLSSTASKVSGGSGLESPLRLRK